MLAIRELPVAGLTPLTTVDWPEQLAAVVFTRGCPWRCPYCHNPDLQKIEGQCYDWERVLGFLNMRRGLLDGVVFSGGEPCMHAALEDALSEVRALGFGTALHTGGAYPRRLAAILDAGLVDWVGFDVKAPWDDYPAITGRQDASARARRSLDILVASGVDYEIRTTVYTPVLTDERLTALATELARSGAKNLVLQPCLDRPDLPSAGAPRLSQLADRLFPFVGPVQVRT